MVGGSREQAQRDSRRCARVKIAGGYRGDRRTLLENADRCPHVQKRMPQSAARQQPLARKEPNMDVDIGIADKDRVAIAQGLSRVLADTYTLYLKTHNFHWNVTGPMFQTLHLMFETQYNELALAVDQIAERIRALGLPAPGTYTEFARLSSIKESAGVPKAEDMIAELVKGQEAVVRTARNAFPLAEKANDQPTMDLLTQRMQVHEKTAWMLRSLLEK
jgi:starvation-inducible DNA-binding protein